MIANLRLPEQPCCAASVRDRIEAVLGNGWHVDKNWTALSLRLLAQQVPNRLPEVLNGCFAVAWTSKPFQGFSNVAPCPNCGKRHDICIIDLRLLKLISSVVSEIEASLLGKRAPPLHFKKVTKDNMQKAKEIVKKTLFRDLDSIEIVGQRPDDTLAEEFFSNCAVHALAFVITHETSHMGPGAALGVAFASSRIRLISNYARNVEASIEQTAAWAEELTTDLNAFSMMHMALFRPDSEHSLEQREFWDASLLTGATLTLKIIEVVQNAVYPIIPGISLANQPATIRHPPGSLRLLSLWRAVDAGIRQGFQVTGLWHKSARNLSACLEDLFDLRRFTARGA